MAPRAIPLAENAKILRELLGGKRTGPLADTVALNAGAGLYVAGVAASVKEGCEQAAAAMKAGTPLALMEKWAACSQQE